MKERERAKENEGEGEGGRMKEREREKEKKRRYLVSRLERIVDVAVAVAEAGRVHHQAPCAVHRGESGRLLPTSLYGCI